MKLKFASPTIGPGGTTKFCIDVASAMSIMKRRKYAQHRLWTITGGYIVDNSTNAAVTFSVAPDNWLTRRALHRCADEYFQQQNDAFNAGSVNVKPRWHDYRVYLLKSQADGSTQTLVNPDDSLGNDYPNGDWHYSKLYQTPNSGTNADEFTVHVVGDHAILGGNKISYGAIQGWVDSRPQVQREPIIDNAQEVLMQNDWLVQLRDAEHTYNEIIEDAQDEGDEPPYDRVNPPNETMDVAYAASQPGGSSISYFPGFTALCGQIEVQVNGDPGGDVTIVLEVIPGGEWFDEDDV